MIRKITKSLPILAVALTALFAILIPNSSLSQPQFSPDSAPTYNDPLGVEYGKHTGLSKEDPRTIVGRIIKVFLGLLGAIALVLILYGGFMIMTAAGNDEKVETGKDILTYAVIGLIIILTAYSITTFVLENIYDATTAQ